MFTPYMTAGPGVRFIDGYQALDPTDNLVEIPKSKDVTINVGFGAFYWIGRTWGINFNYVAKHDEPELRFFLNTMPDLFLSTSSD